MWGMGRTEGEPGKAPPAAQVRPCQAVLTSGWGVIQLDARCWQAQPAGLLTAVTVEARKAAVTL